MVHFAVEVRTVVHYMRIAGVYQFLLGAFVLRIDQQVLDMGPDA